MQLILEKAEKKYYIRGYVVIVNGISNFYEDDR